MRTVGSERSGVRGTYLLPQKGRPLFVGQARVSRHIGVVQVSCVRLFLSSCPCRFGAAVCPRKVDPRTCCQWAIPCFEPFRLVP